MSGCCTPRGYRWIFSARSAEKEARRYRKRGLDPSSRRVVDLLLERGVQGRTVLEIGGGIGAIQIALLKSGAVRAMSVEMTPTYEAAADVLLREHGLTATVDRRLADFTEVSADIPIADIVILHRVLCCYPDMPRLAGAAADHTGQMLVLSFPKVTWWTRLLLGFGNLALRVARREFQVFLHRPESIRRAAEAHGLRPLSSGMGLFWQILTFETSGPQSA